MPTTRGRDLPGPARSPRATAPRRKRARPARRRIAQGVPAAGADPTRLVRNLAGADTIEAAAANMATLAPELADPALMGEEAEFERVRPAVAQAVRRTKDSEFHSLDLVLGYTYEGSPIIAEGAGERLPHRWLAPGVSLYDRLGRGFSVVGDQRLPGAAELAEQARELGVPLRAVDLPGTPLVLVRPDQHVAWRGRAPRRRAKAGALSPARQQPPLTMAPRSTLHWGPLTLFPPLTVLLLSTEKLAFWKLPLFTCRPLPRKLPLFQELPLSLGIPCPRAGKAGGSDNISASCAATTPVRRLKVRITGHRGTDWEPLALLPPPMVLPLFTEPFALSKLPLLMGFPSL
ncbi:hypothetical protein AB0J35_08425 [Nonomuraea angiospora]|uniref:aromatic-ring hydroxylase C-terminal domain-containing protein n=1 Tax=Nonomuraea angiospora TaxID=46172 RepID=UPI00341B66BC